MRIYKARDYDDVSRKAANVLSAQVILEPRSVLGLATGSSPIGVYRQLIKWYSKSDIDFSEITTINLDEYVGLAPANPQSYRHFMNEHFLGHINIDLANTHLPNGLAEDAARECARYDEVIRRSGGIDIQLLGLGHNGHIGFNEPNASFGLDTHCVTLTERTIEANKRFFEREEDVPRQAFTMGIRAIMRAKRILVVVSGEDKADIVWQSFAGPVTPAVPASVLQLHNNVMLVGDESALTLLREKAVFF